jgi:hypothetical protein
MRGQRTEVRSPNDEYGMEPAECRSFSFGWIGRSAGDAKYTRLKPTIKTSSDGALDPPTPPWLQRSFIIPPPVPASG